MPSHEASCAVRNDKLPNRLQCLGILRMVSVLYYLRHRESDQTPFCLHHACVRWESVPTASSNAGVQQTRVPHRLCHVQLVRLQPMHEVVWKWRHPDSQAEDHYDAHSRRQHVPGFCRGAQMQQWSVPNPLRHERVDGLVPVLKELRRWDAGSFTQRCKACEVWWIRVPKFEGVAEVQHGCLPC